MVDLLPPSSWPKSLVPTATHPVRQAGGTTIQIPKATPKFRQWNGSEEGIHTYGNKALVEFAGRPLFAELAILHTFLEAGWEGVWIDTYRKKFWRDLPGVGIPVRLQNERQALYNRLKELNGGISGFWDVFAWKGKETVFAEAKRVDEDRIRPTQERWLTAALTCGLQLDSFLIVEWSLEERG